MVSILVYKCGDFRLSKDFGNPPSYEEVSAAGPVKEKEKPTNHHIFAAHEEQKVPEGLYSTVDKSKKAQSVAKGTSSYNISNHMSIYIRIHL